MYEDVRPEEHADAILEFLNGIAERSNVAGSVREPNSDGIDLAESADQLSVSEVPSEEFAAPDSELAVLNSETSTMEVIKALENPASAEPNQLAQGGNFVLINLSINKQFGMKEDQTIIHHILHTHVLGINIDIYIWKERMKLE